MKLTSPGFQHGDVIPRDHTCEGADLSPPLTWTDVPVERRSLALVCEDPDAPRGTWIHWVLYNLPAESAELSPGIPQLPELPSGARQGRNDSGDIGYNGPCPPPGKPHRYYFRLYALDTMLNLPHGVSRAELDRAMADHILDQATLMGMYQRK
ncbi:MAG TPA: YbhB/YbcL family Raf kinase inhibitor-like protein [Gemmatimonadales bacterium]